MEDKRSYAHQVQCPIAPFQLPWRPLLGLCGYAAPRDWFWANGKRPLELSGWGREKPVSESAASFFFYHGQCGGPMMTG